MDTSNRTDPVWNSARDFHRPQCKYWWFNTLNAQWRGHRTPEPLCVRARRLYEAFFRSFLLFGSSKLLWSQNAAMKPLHRTRLQRYLHCNLHKDPDRHILMSDFSISCTQKEGFLYWLHTYYTFSYSLPPLLFVWTLLLKKGNPSYRSVMKLQSGGAQTMRMDYSEDQELSWNTLLVRGGVDEHGKDSFSLSSDCFCRNNIYI